MKGKPSSEKKIPKKFGTNQLELLYTAFSNGWRLEVYLFDGTVLKGKLSGYDSYDIVFITDEGELYLLFKHFIKYIKPVFPA